MVDKKKIVDKVKKIVYQKLKNESSGHDYWHCFRVATLAEQIGRKYKADIFALKLAGFLHDIASLEDRQTHNILGAQRADRIMRDLKVDQKTREKVKLCILHHRYSGKEITNLSIEEKIIQDSDKIDVLGAIGIARIFAFAGKYDIPTHDPKIKADPEKYLIVGHGSTAINHFQEKIFKVIDKMHTPMAKTIALEREKFMKTFLKKFFSEWEGKE